MIAGLLIAFQPWAHAAILAGSPPVSRFRPDLDVYPENFAIAEDSDAVVYVANNDGVLTFDGGDWHLIRLPNHQLVRSLAYDGKSRVYVGGYNELGYIARDPAGQLVYHDLTHLFSKLLQGQTFADIWTVKVTSAGILFQALQHLFLYSPSTGRAHLWRYSGRFGEIGTYHGRVFAQFRGEGLKYLDHDHWKMMPGGQVLTKHIYADLALPDGGILFLITDGSWLEYRNGEVHSFAMQAGLPAASYFSDGASLADGTLAVNPTQLNNALATSPGDLAAIFAAVGNTSDSLVNYSSATSRTKPGSYAVNVTQLATRGTAQGSLVLPSSTTIGATNNALNVSVDGASASVTLGAGSYAPAALAAALQSKINGAFSGSGHSVSVSLTSSGTLKIASDQYGSASNVSIRDGASNGALATLLGTVSQTAGQDVSGSINGMAATGQGQTLTSTVGDSQGISLNILGGNTGARGTVSYSQGAAYNLNNLITSLLGSNGLIASETNGLNASITNVNQQISNLNTQIARDKSTLTQQYAQLDSMLGTMNNLSSYLTQQLAQLPG